MCPKRRLRYYPKLTERANDATPKLTLSAHSLALIQHTAAESPASENGGILIGHHSAKDIQVVKATDAGPNARRSPCGFLRDTAYCQRILDAEFAASGADYLGEWHSHVVDLPRPSKGDLQTLAAIILDPDYNLPSFAMVLAIVRSGKVELLSYIVTADPVNDGSGLRIVTVAQVVPLIV